MKAIILTLKIFLGLIGSTLVFQGFMWSFFPESNMEMDGIVTNSTLGINMIKTDIGAPLMIVGLFQILFVIGNDEFFKPLVIIASAYLVVRTMSFFVDGSHPMIITGIIMELIVPALNILLFRLKNQNVQV